MKKIYLLIILLVSGLGFAQGPVVGSYQIVFNGWAYGDEHHNCGDASVTLEFSTPKDNLKVLSVSYTDDRKTTSYPNVSNTFTADKTPVSMFFSASRYDRQSCNGNRPHNSGRIYSTNKFNCFDYDFEFKQFKNVENSGDGLGSSLFNVKVRPILVIVDPGANRDLPTETNITINSNTGFFPSEYNWQYTFNPTSNPRDWIDLPQFNTKSSITINAKSILGADAGKYHGRQIYFRQKACSNTFSDPVYYVVRQSAPLIASHNEIETTCFNTQDGKLVMKFDRPLFQGEHFTFSIREFDEITQKWKGVICSSQSSEITLDSNNSYTFPCDFATGKYGLDFIGFINGFNTNPPIDADHPFVFNITAPAPVDFSLSKTNVNCNGSKDGTLTITASGGSKEGYEYSLDNGVNWIPFTDTKSTTQILKGLYPISNVPIAYSIKVRDKKGCIAQENDKDKILTETISQPDGPLVVNYTFTSDPTFYGAFNGKIVASITGGTINDDKTYSYEWKNDNGDVMPASAAYNSADKTYNITLSDAPDGEYKLTVKDKNYNAATNKTACSIIESSKILTQPEKIDITLQETTPISCNTENLEPIIGNKNKLSDAVITATVVGGVKPYTYIWSKQDPDTKNWDKLDDQKTAVATGLSAGEYSLNIIDANGMSQGTYNTVKLTEAIPDLITITEPVKLELTFKTVNVSCFKGNNGSLEAVVKGGNEKFPYDYVWSDSDGVKVGDTAILTQLIAGTYFVLVTDKNGCYIKGSQVIEEPKAMLALKYLETTPPAFFGATNGRIVAEVTGGTPKSDKSYNYVWKNEAGASLKTTPEVINGKFIITLNGVPAGNYYLTITDENYEDTPGKIVYCSILNSIRELTDPAPLKVLFEITHPISCNAKNAFGSDVDTTPNDGQRDESQDGVLVAHVTGGVTLFDSDNNGEPYYFYWKKQREDNTWEDLPAIKGAIASNLSHGTYALNIKDRNGIMLGTYVDNQLKTPIDVTQFLEQPSILSVTITKGNVFCNGGNDGWATATATGGILPYHYVWSNDVKIEENTILKAGEYLVYVTDGRGCITQKSVTITEPDAPLAVKYTQVLNPSFYQATNGKIVAEVTGGKIFKDNTYEYEWKNSKGVIQKSTTAKFNNNVYEITLNGVSEDTYFLTVRDAQYKDAVNKNGCNVTDSSVTLEEPAPLKVVFEVIRTISCNANNEFGNETDSNPVDGQRDESQDGILVAHVTGGIPLKAEQNNGLNYFYTWKKRQKDNSWTAWNDHDETLENVSNGIYALNIEDANGIKLGTYVNNILTKEIDVTQDMPEPSKLNLTFTKFDVGCTTGDDGWAEAHVSGGTPPYTYQWTNEAITPRIENLTTNNYFLRVTDAKGCSVQGSIFVGNPNGIRSTEITKDPACFNGNDGSIVLNVTGGNLPYSYLWNTGATTKDLNNLKAGNYEVTISCPDCCVYKNRFVLKNPDQIVIDLGPDRTLCIDQTLELNAAINDDKAQYAWTSTNGFSSNEAKVSLTKAGTYHAKVTSGLGCIAEDEIVIKISQAAISAEFLLSSQAYLDEEVILINTSNPFGESTEWVIPKGVKIVEQKEKYITLKFDATGSYTIGLLQTQGECYASYNKNIMVEERGTMPNSGNASKSIIDFIITPNPNDGNFKAIVNLENNNPINLRLFSAAGQNTMIQKKESGKKNYEVDFNTSLAAGIYIIVLETEQQTLVKKIIIF
ncbi:putative secreted protein (Por secretion system target) [Flavobacterium sp. 270]|uniref:T9SS type A sorting domain-containing protein n=1 Tax=Flavobacterium sp. 270 TaxID=2512114 RepID=UPI001065ECDF|nr:T9SS type A sorting domain-containing protein [Flavobacterium sp. 270]TDW52805.1 putative secreted protein (Por secretion system target) [Flavobacterium sp. 270]